MKANTTAENLMLCQEKFKDKNWYSDERISSLMRRMSRLNSEEKSLVLDLTDKFIYEDWRDVSKDLFEAYSTIPKIDLDGATNVLFVPLSISNGQQSPKKKTGKSGEMIYELFKSLFPEQTYDYQFCKTIEELLKYYCAGSLLIFLDDFVGTGDTAIESIGAFKNVIKDKTGIVVDKVLLLSVFAMEYAVKILGASGIHCYAQKRLEKAISDNKLIDEHTREVQRRAMKMIERNVLSKLSKDYSLGYGASETLLSIDDRCPNNTFPFYWFRSKNDLSPIFKRN
jgi:hypothetical protein